MSSIQVNPLSETNFFAEVVGADLKQDDDDQFAAIKAAHLKHGVIVIRDQAMTPDDQICFSRRFGPLAIHVLEDQLLEVNGFTALNSSPDVVHFSTGVDVEIYSLKRTD